MTIPTSKVEEVVKKVPRLTDSEIERLREALSDGSTQDRRPKDQNGHIIDLNDIVMYQPDKFKFKRKITRLKAGVTYRVIGMSSTAIKVQYIGEPLQQSYSAKHFVIFKKFKSSFMEAVENL